MGMNGTAYEKRPRFTVYVGFFGHSAYNLYRYYDAVIAYAIMPLKLSTPFYTDMTRYDHFD